MTIHRFIFLVITAGHAIPVYGLVFLLTDSKWASPRSLFEAYLLWAPFGMYENRFSQCDAAPTVLICHFSFGLHHFYLRNHYRGLGYLLSFGGFGLLWLSDLVLMPRWLDQSLQDSRTRVPPRRLVDAAALWASFGGCLGLHHYYLHRPNQWCDSITLELIRFCSLF